MASLQCPTSAIMHKTQFTFSFFGQAHVDDFRYLSQVQRAPHIVIGTDKTADHHGILRVRLGRDDPFLTAISGVSYLPSGPCCLTAPALGKEIRWRPGGHLFLKPAPKKKVVYFGTSNIKTGLSLIDVDVRTTAQKDPLSEIESRPIDIGMIQSSPTHSHSWSIADRDERGFASSCSSETSDVEEVGPPISGREEAPSAPSGVQANLSICQPTPLKRPPAPRPEKQQQNVENAAAKRQKVFELVTLLGRPNPNSALLYQHGSILDQPVVEHNPDQHENEEQDLVADRLEASLVERAGILNVSQVHLLLGHMPACGSVPYNVYQGLAAPTHPPGSVFGCKKCETRIGFDLPRAHFRDQYVQAKEVGSVINAFVIRCPASEDHIAVLAEERSSFMMSHFLAKESPDVDFVLVVRNLIRIIENGPHPTPEIIKLRYSFSDDPVFSDQSPALAGLIREGDVRPIHDNLASVLHIENFGPVEIKEILLDRRDRFREAGLLNDSIFRYEVNFIVHSMNCARFGGFRSPGLFLTGRVDDRLWFGYREEIMVEINKKLVRAELVGYGQTKFNYLVRYKNEIKAAWYVERICPDFP